MVSVSARKIVKPMKIVFNLLFNFGVKFIANNRNMKLTNQQIQSLANQIMARWKSSHYIRFKADEKTVFDKIVQIIVADFQREADLERDVNKMLDDLEKSHGGEFQRYKMYPLLKNKLAKERKVIL